MYIVFLTRSDVHSFCKTQIASFIKDQALIVIPVEYTDFADLFFFNLVVKLPKQIEINYYFINLVESQQLPYRLIYYLKSVELEILKRYIKINLAKYFIRSFKYLVGAFIFFVQKSSKSL